jgi:hypothetical protein
MQSHIRKRLGVRPRRLPQLVGAEVEAGEAAVLRLQRHRQRRAGRIPQLAAAEEKGKNATEPPKRVWIN